MPKQFFTEKEIEDLFNRGARSLRLTRDVVLTELAYEKARRLGLQLIQDGPDAPPSAPVRPYLSQTPARPAAASPAEPVRADLQTRIRQAVRARLGDQIEPALLDNIIQRVLKSTGLK